jgi:hypothetical protein
MSDAGFLRLGRQRPRVETLAFILAVRFAHRIPAEFPPGRVRQDIFIQAARRRIP